jgi:putative restriction endonuclease
VVPNGVALCKLHHAAFDRYLIGVTPDLEDSTGQGRCIHVHVPRADHLKPNRDFLAERYALVRRAS